MRFFVVLVAAATLTGTAAAKPPLELIDPDGEGIYLLEGQPMLLMRAAWLFHGTWTAWRDVDSALVFMRPGDGDEWRPANIGRFPRGWRLNLPSRWRPVAYVYCTPAETGAA